MEQHDLFGGTIEIKLPSSLIDVSDFRQVPDHQEVFADGNTDTSFIFEILERPEHLPDQEALTYYWNDLVESNEAVTDAIQSTEILDVQKLGLNHQHSDCFAASLTGEQLVPKGKDSIEKANLVQVRLDHTSRLMKVF